MIPFFFSFFFESKSYLDFCWLDIDFEVLHEEDPAQGPNTETIGTLAVVPEPHEGHLAVAAITELDRQELLVQRGRHNAFDCGEDQSYLGYYGHRKIQLLRYCEEELIYILVLIQRWTSMWAKRRVTFWGRLLSCHLLASRSSQA